MKNVLTVGAVLTVAWVAVGADTYFNPGDVAPETPVDLTDLSVWHEGSKTGKAIADLAALQSNKAWYLEATNTVTVPANTQLKINQLYFSDRTAKTGAKMVCDFPASSSLEITKFYGGQTALAKDFVWLGGTFCAKTFFHEWHGTALFSGASTRVVNSAFSLQHHDLKYVFSDGVLATNCTFTTGSGADSYNNFYIFHGVGTTLSNCTFKVSSSHNVFELTNGVKVVNCGDITLSGSTNRFTVSGSEMSLSKVYFSANQVPYPHDNVVTFNQGSKITRTSNSYTIQGQNGGRNTVNIEGAGTTFEGWTTRLQGPGDALNVSGGASYDGYSIDLGYGDLGAGGRLSVRGSGTQLALAAGLNVCSLARKARSGDVRAVVSDHAVMCVGDVKVGSEFAHDSVVRVEGGAMLSVTNASQNNVSIDVTASGGNNGIEIENGTMSYGLKQMVFGNGAAGPDGTNYVLVAGTNGYLSCRRMISWGQPMELRFSVPREGKTDARPYVDLDPNTSGYAPFDNTASRFRLRLAADAKWARGGRDKSVDLIRVPLATSKDSVTELETLKASASADELGAMTLAVVTDDEYVYLRLTAGPKQGMVVLIH